MVALTTAPPARSRNDEAKIARRRAILAAARRVLDRKGFHGTTVGDIAREADVAVGTFYLYFPSKQAVFEALHEQLFESIDGAVSAAASPGEDMSKQTRARIRAAFETCWENRDLLRLITLNTDPRSKMARRLQQANRKRSQPLADLLRAGMDAGVVREDHPELLARMINGLVSFAIYDCYVLGEGQNTEGVQDVVARMVAAALAPAKEREEAP